MISLRRHHPLVFAVAALACTACTAPAVEAPADLKSDPATVQPEATVSDRKPVVTAPWPKVPAPRVADDSASGLLDAGEQVRLERSGCGFRCPAYRLSFYADGRVIFTGRAHTAVSGEAQDRIPAADLQVLMDDLRAQLPTVAGRYQPGTPGCGQMMTDQPTIKLAARLDGQVLSSVRYGGCPDAPPALAELERRVDAAAASSRWVSAAPVF